MLVLPSRETIKGLLLRLSVAEVKLINNKSKSNTEWLFESEAVWTDVTSKVADG